MYMRAFAEAWPEEPIVQQLVGRLPWGHNLVLMTRLKDSAQRMAYASAAIEHGWSRNVLNIHIETRRAPLARQARPLKRLSCLRVLFKPAADESEASPRRPR